jgi:hypothetical protein
MLNADEESIAALLPFYANGTLNAADCARVDAALAGSTALQEELAAIGTLAHLAKAGGREMTQGDDRSDARLHMVLGRVEDKPPHAEPQTAAPQPPPRATGGLLSFLNPKHWHPSVSLALAAAFVAQGVAIANLGGGRQESQSQIASLQKRVGDLEFELASGPGGGPDGQNVGTIIIVVKADAPWSDVEDLLGKEGLSIVGGPSDGAITVSSGALGAALDAQINRIRASSLIESVDKAA